MDLFKTPSARELFAPDPAQREPVWKLAVAALRRRKLPAVCCVGASLVAGLIYIVSTPRLVETSTTVRVEAADMSEPGMEATASSLLAQQPEVMRSSLVIELALASPEAHGLSLLRGKKSRLDFVNSNLKIHSLGESGVYELTFTSSNPADAEKLLDAMVSAYKQFQSTPHPGGQHQTSALQDQKQKIDAELAAKRTELDEVLKQQRQISPTPEARQRLARDRAELLAALGAAGQNLDPENPIRARLNLLEKQAEANDALDDQASQLQAEIERLTSESDELGQRLGALGQTGENQVSITLLEPPETDPSAVWPKPWTILGECALAGILLGLIVALALDQIADRLHDDADASSLARMPVIGRLPPLPSDLSSPILRGQCVLVNPSSPAAQACRDIRAAIEGIVSAGLDKTILVTSPGNAHGKSVLACNLAIAMARSGQRVALVDAHHHNPMVNKIFAIEDTVGLNSAIEGALSVRNSLHVTALANLEIMPTGASDADWSQLLNRPEFLSVLTELAEKFDCVVIDGGPSQMDETRIISAFCDATILAVDAQRCRRRELKSAVQGLRAVGAKLVGIVLNDLPAHRLDISRRLPLNAIRRRRAPIVNAPRFAETT